MMTPGKLTGGKTAPRLLQDLLTFDPRRRRLKTGLDSLSEIPYFDASKETEDPPLRSSSCHHEWALKKDQSSLPSDHVYDVSVSSKWIFRCYCAKCRLHLQAIISSDASQASYSPCPSGDRPLHHFHVTPGWQSPDHSSDINEDCILPPEQFRCSAYQCGANLTISYTAPRLKNDWINLLTDKFLIKSRFDKTIATQPERFEGYPLPTPNILLEALRASVIKRALEELNPIPIPKNGSQFLLKFGEPFNELLEALGMISKGDTWEFPQLHPETSDPPIDSKRSFLQDALEEIEGVMRLRLNEDKSASKNDSTSSLAMKDISLALRCDKYRRNSQDLSVDLTAPEHPSYASLGAVADFHDELIYFAYDRQITADGWHVPYYLECLQIIAKGRDSEHLSTKAAIEESQGRTSLRDVRLAYEHLGLNHHDKTISQENIVGCFQARLADAPKQESELRRDLGIIGIDRGSAYIQDVAAQSVNTYEQAIAFLDATEDLGDDFIISYFTVKVSSKPSEETTARQAVAIIANHRKSHALKNWLDTGEVGEVEMDVGQAYARFDISDRTINDETIINVFDLSVSDTPSQAAELRRAFLTIAKDRKSTILMEHAGLNFDDSSHPLSEWPVALNNIGNTCYLNSLLQFYFSIKPFRDLVLDIDDFTTPLDNDHIKSKRIGGRSVSKKEVERAQRTAHELRALFKDLITSPSRSVRPNTEVARLTLLTPKAEIARRQSIRQSVDGQIRPNLNGLKFEPSAENMQSLEPADSSTNMVVDHNIAKDLDDQNVIGKDHLSDSSSETLVDELAGSEANDSVLSAIRKQQHKNAHPSQQLDARERMDIDPNKPISGDDKSEDKAPIEGPKSVAEAKAPPPNQPPPVPPRPKTNAEPDEAVREAEFAAQQQDVNEIAYNILNQLQCAIKPETTDNDGEQIDQIKQLFYGKQKSYITNQSGIVRHKEEFMSDIKVNVQGGPADIYSALDGAFDEEDVAVAGGIEPRYSTISHLPPILQIHIQRGQYDPRAKTQFKSNNHLDIKDVIYMDRYMDNPDPDLMQRRRESWSWKQRLARLVFRRRQLTVSEVGMEIPEVLRCATSYLNKIRSIEGEHRIDVPSTLVDVLQKAAGEAKEELKVIESSISDLRDKIAHQFEHLSQIPYKLAAVFIHRGSSNAGHYWVYIFDFNAGIWRKYNDERVTPVNDVKEIFEEPTGPRPPTPYFLVYVKDEIRAELVDPVCRHVVDVPVEESKDHEMAEYVPVDLKKPIQPIDASKPSAPTYYGTSDEHVWDTNHAQQGDGW